MEQTNLTTDPSKETLLDYLLGKLPEAEAGPLEERCFTECEQYYRLCEAEQALIDDYLRGYLSAAERARFEQHFLALPARAERVKAARVLLGKIDGTVPHNQQVEKTAWWKELMAQLRAPRPAWIFAAAACLLLAVGGWLLVNQSKRLRTEVAQAQAERADWQRRAQTLEQQVAAERAASAQLSETLDSLRNPPPTTALQPIVLALAAGVLRGPEGQALPSLTLPKKSATEQTVQLRLRLAGMTYPRYEAVLQTAEGRVIKSWHGLKAIKPSPEQTRLNLSLPAGQLPAADFVLILKGAPVSPAVAGEEIARSVFRVVRP